MPIRRLEAVSNWRTLQEHEGSQGVTPFQRRLFGVMAEMKLSWWERVVDLPSVNVPPDISTRHVTWSFQGTPYHGYQLTKSSSNLYTSLPRRGFVSFVMGNVSATTCWGI